MDNPHFCTFVQKNLSPFNKKKIDVGEESHACIHMQMYITVQNYTLVQGNHSGHHQNCGATTDTPDAPNLVLIWLKQGPSFRDFSFTSSEDYICQGNGALTHIGYAAAPTGFVVMCACLRTFCCFICFLVLITSFGQR